MDDVTFEDEDLEKLDFESLILFSNSNLLALYYPTIKLVHYIWRRRTVGVEYQNSFLRGIEEASKFETLYFLSDIRLQGVTSPDDRKWFQEVAIPLGIKAGLKKVAAVFDGNVFKKYYVNMIFKHLANTGIPMQIFLHLEDAKNWLFKKE